LKPDSSRSAAGRIFVVRTLLTPIEALKLLSSLLPGPIEEFEPYLRRLRH